MEADSSSSMCIYIYIHKGRKSAWHAFINVSFDFCSSDRFEWRLSLSMKICSGRNQWRGAIFSWMRKGWNETWINIETRRWRKKEGRFWKCLKLFLNICPPLFAEIKRRKVQEEGRRLKTRLTRIFSLFLFQVSRGWRILSKRAYFFQNFKTPSLQISNRYSISKLLCPFHEHHS